MQNVVKCAEVANSFAATVSYSSQIWVEMALIGQPKAAYESASTIGKAYSVRFCHAVERMAHLTSL